MGMAGKIQMVIFGDYPKMSKYKEGRISTGFGPSPDQSGVGESWMF